MTDQEFQRRASYGPSSPLVGTRGAQTRAQISQAALHCFTTKGFFETSIDDIASLAETSRATLYQYFESKDAIFIELMIESGTALSKSVRHIGHLGPDLTGFTSLTNWLRASSQIYDTYAPMFIEWANVNTGQGHLRDQVAGYVDFHVDRFSAALVEGGFNSDEPDVAAVLVLAAYTRYNYIRHVYRPSPSDEELTNSLACALQRYLFPETPDKVLASASVFGTPGDGPAGTGDDRPAVNSMGPLSTLPARSSIERSDPFSDLSEQAARTVRQLLDAAGRVFATYGYHAANVDQIVTEAGLARGTFYRYFSDRLELMTQLSHEAAAAMCTLFDRFASVASEPAQLRAWLGEFLLEQRRYSGVMRAWTEGLPIEPALLAGAADVVAAMGGAIEATFGGPRDYPLERRAAGMLLSSILEHFPNEAAGAEHEPTSEQIIESQARFIERVVLAG